MYNINWSKINNGATGFETLAREYVKDVFKFPKGEWKESPATHDGNKDAYTIIIGFHPDLFENEVWWMEAKYSKDTVYLSRFRLDATIVSSIYNRSVKKIIFVTNINIKAKVISDVRTALYYGTSCKETYFCTKKTLEFWLFNHPSVYKNYFDEPISSLLEVPDLFVSEDISIYSSSNVMRDTEELYSIITNNIYEAHFKIISNCKQKIKITTAQKGIQRISDSRLILQSGENSLVVKFAIKDCFFNNKKHAYDGIEENNLSLFKINLQIPVMLKYPLSIAKNSETQLNIKSQCVFQKDFNSFKIDRTASYWLIDGKAGYGKTTVIQKCVEQKYSHSGNYRYVKFKSNRSKNNIELLDTIFSIIFPFMYTEDITIEYLEKIIIEQNLKNNLKKLIEIKSDCDKLKEYISILDANNISLFPDMLSINPKVIIFDDLQNLDKDNIEFLFYILKKTQGFPLAFVLITQSYFLENSNFTYKNVPFVWRQYHFELTADDIILNIYQIFSFEFDIANSLVEFFFPNIIIFNIYVKYVSEIKEKIYNIDDFILSYINFKQNYIFDEYINRQFNEIALISNSAWNLCEKIYASTNGIAPSKLFVKEISLLLQIGVVKYSNTNFLIPFHEIYYKHFKKRKFEGINTKNPLDKLYKEIEQCKFANDLEPIYSQISQMRKNEEFQSVNYVLEGIFENHSVNNYRQLWGDELFYLLYYEYSYSAINCNSSITGYEYLQTIYNGIKGNSSIRLQLLRLEILFELINCDYNQGEYTKCKEYYNDYQLHYKGLLKKGIIGQNNMYNLFSTLCTGYMLLIDSEEEKKGVLESAIEYKKLLKKDYFHHYIDFCMQFSETLCIRNWDIAYAWIEEAFNALSATSEFVSKQKIKVSFKFYFMQCLNKNNSVYPLKELECQMNLAKNKIYSSYRHQVFLYCGLLYIIDSIDEADSHFFKDVSNTRTIRKKMKGHYYQLISLHYLKHKNTERALDAIQKSMEMFTALHTYFNISLHNYNVIKNNNITNIEYSFCTSDILLANVFYLDPRI